MKETAEQKWLGVFTTAQREDKEMATKVCKLLQKWRNIPDIIYSENTNLRQQLLSTKTYEKSKLQQHIDDLNCRMWSHKQETVTHNYHEHMPKNSPVSIHIMSQQDDLTTTTYSQPMVSMKKVITNDLGINKDHQYQP